MLDFIKSLKSVFDLFALPMQSQFRVLQFDGFATGVPLTPNFNINEIRGRTIVIKGIKVQPFYSDAVNVDISLTDGVTTNNETIPVNYSIERVFEFYGGATWLNILINGQTIPIFQPFDGVTNNGNASLTTDLDNIFYKYPAKLETLDCNCIGVVYSNIDLGLSSNPLVKVFIQCYLI